jgi:Zn-dependent M16 (insulinase) family peptidase
VKDVPVKGETYPTEKEMVDEIPIQWRIAPTNGITYFMAMSKLTGLPGHLKPYLPLFADALSSLGTKTKSASEFENEINLKTDGILGNVSINTHNSGNYSEDCTNGRSWQIR